MRSPAAAVVIGSLKIGSAAGRAAAGGVEAVPRDKSLANFNESRLPPKARATLAALRDAKRARRRCSPKAWGAASG